MASDKMQTRLCERLTELEEKYEKQKKINKELVDENEKLKKDVEYWKNEYYYLKANPEEA